MTSTIITPPARTNHCMAAGSGLIVLFGGMLNSTLLGDTWTFSSNSWVANNPATSPAPCYDAAMTFATSGGLFVLYGGRRVRSASKDTWVWNGSSWLQVAIGSGPSARYGHQMAYDTGSGTVIMQGGVDAGTNTQAIDVWSFNALTLVWSRIG